jgi:uncharacterized damage-inducible protein DinB
MWVPPAALGGRLTFSETRTEPVRYACDDPRMATKQEQETNERADLIAALAKRRSFLRQTVDGLTDEQASKRTTASELCLGGIVKHVAMVEDGWVGFIEHGPSAIGSPDAAAMEAHAATFKMLPDDTLAALLDRYEQVANRTEKTVNDLPSLEMSHPLPEAPWFESGARWTARTVLLHILAETAHHCGHADIIRESLDGAKTMG